MMVTVRIQPCRRDTKEQAMTLDRRAFIAGTGAVVIAPTLQLWPLPAVAGNTDMNRVEFMIEGWSADDVSGAPDRVWIRLNRSWQVAWR
jgi:hypothetical protein